VARPVLLDAQVPFFDQNSQRRPHRRIGRRILHAVADLRRGGVSVPVHDVEDFPLAAAQRRLGARHADTLPVLMLKKQQYVRKSGWARWERGEGVPAGEFRGRSWLMLSQ